MGLVWRRICASKITRQTKRRFKSSQTSLPWMLTIPFILQVVSVVGLVGYLSYQNGQRSVEELTNQLLDSASKRIEQQLISYLAAPRLINQLNSDAVRRGNLTLDLERIDAQRDQYLWQQMQRFNQLTWLSLGSERGHYLGAWRPEKTQPVQLAIANSSTQFYVSYYASDPQGKRTQLQKVEKPTYDPRTRPWYQVVKLTDAQTAVWTPIYPGFTPGTVFIAMSQPLYAPNGKFVGVSSADLSLSGIQTFLAQNPVSPNGQIFLMERSGLLVASSMQEFPFRSRAGQPPQRVNVLDSQTPLIRSTAQFLHQRSHGFRTLKQSQKFRFESDRQPEFVQVLPFSQEPGLDWILVIVMPESDVMTQIRTGTYATIWLCLGALLAVIGLNTVISHWLVKPIVDLSQASQRIAQGNFSYPIRAPRIRELSMLADSFARMSQEIQQSRQQLEDYSRSLEQKINDRTQALQQEIQQRLTVEAALQTANQKLQTLAYVDALTEIANRRRFDERLLLEWRKMKRERSPLSMILCDVDYFKQYNDVYGHQLGDDCLRQVAGAIAAAARRPSDLAARYGGEEFAVLLPNTGLDGAMEVARTIQTHIKNLQLIHQQSQVDQYLTVSFGIASVIPTEAVAPEELLFQSDRALYQAKTEGRNCVRCIEI